jgi:5-methylcytosine-specific restriction endonuclease McrA
MGPADGISLRPTRLSSPGKFQIPYNALGSLYNGDLPLTQADDALLLYCPACERWRPRGWFRRSGEGRRTSHCRDCRSGLDSAHAAKRRGAGVVGESRATRLTLYRRQRGICPLCGRHLFGLSGTHIDHWVPVAKGGQHTDENLRLTHNKCNLASGAKLKISRVR